MPNNKMMHLRLRKLRATKEPARRKPRKRGNARPRKATQAIVLAKPVPAPVEMVSIIPKIEQTIENLERVRRFVSNALNRDLQRELAKLERQTKLTAEERAKQELALRARLEIDWGTIPGVDKPFLKQPGAEKFMLWLNLRPRYTKKEREMEGGHLEMVCSVTVYHKKTGEEVFEGPDCSCSTMETNYRYRWAEVDKPTDDEVARLKAIGFGRFKKMKRWAHGKVVKEEWAWFQRVENPNIHDERNKVRQIGEKRALVKCVRNMGAISEIFTADPSEWDIPPEDGGSPENDQDFTPSGRQVFTEEGVSPSGRYQDTRKPTGEARGPRQEQAPSSNTQEAKPAQAAAPIQKPRPKITLTWPADKDGCGYLSGAMDTFLPLIKEAVLCQWLDSKKAYAIPATEAHVVADIAAKNEFEFIEVSGALTKGADLRPSTPAQPEPAAAGRSAEPPSRAPAAGFLVSAKPGKTKEKNVPYMDTKIGSTHYRCYNTDLHPFLNAGVGQDSEVFVNERKCIVGIKRIGKRMFDEDGKTPIVDINEERPKTTGELFT